jgi:hypothetical protein
MLSQDKLLKVIDEDLNYCRGAVERLNPTDTKGRERNILEFNTLLQHFQWAERAGDDQEELEKIVRSLETNGFLRGYQDWRERSETPSCPDHKQLMRFPTSLRLESGNVIEHLHYCPVQECTWRYASSIGYKKATEF